MCMARDAASQRAFERVLAFVHLCVHFLGLPRVPVCVCVCHCYCASGLGHREHLELNLRARLSMRI